MPIPVALFQFRGKAFDSGDISFGQAETKDIQINRNGNINKVQIAKESVTFSIKGAIDADLSEFDAERANNVIGLINGSVTGEDIDILGRKVYSAILTRVNPSAPISVNGVTIFETIELEYASQVWT